MNLPNDWARCEGFYPSSDILLAICKDCERRLQIARDVGRQRVVYFVEAPADRKTFECKDRLQG